MFITFKNIALPKAVLFVKGIDGPNCYVVRSKHPKLPFQQYVC